MPGKSGRSGPQGTAANRIAGTSSRPTAEQTYAGLMKPTESEKPDFMRDYDAEVSHHRSPERRQLLEGSRYVGVWGDWNPSPSEHHRIDYGLLAFLAECCFTFIEATRNQEKTSGSPIMALPQWNGTGEGYFDAICWIAARWQVSDILAIPKSRRMIVSWLTRCMDFWDILFHPGSQLYVRCDKLEDSEKMVHRMKFLYDHLPSSRIPRSCLPPCETIAGEAKAGVHDQLNRVTIRHSLHEPGQMDSFIQAVSQRDDLRGVGSKRITIDEAAKQRDLKKLWAGLMGTRIGASGSTETGQIVLVSTPVAGSYMADLVLDKKPEKE